MGNEDRHAPMPWYRTPQRRAQQRDLETRAAESPALHEKVASLQKRLRTRNLLPFLSAWYVSVVQERQGHPALAKYVLADRIGSAARALETHADRIPKGKRSEARLRETLCELIDAETARALIPERSDAPLPTYEGFRRSIVQACAKQLDGKRISGGKGLPILLGITGSALYMIRHAKTAEYLPPLNAAEVGAMRLRDSLGTEQIADALRALYIEAVVRRHPESWENVLQHNRGVRLLSEERQRLRERIGKRDAGAVLREALSAIVDRETVNALLPVRHDVPHRTLRGFEKLLFASAHAQIGSYRRTAEAFGTYTQEVISRARGNVRDYAPLPRTFLSMREFLACYSAYAVPTGRYSSAAQRLSTNLHTLRARAAQGHALLREGLDFPGYVNRTIYRPEDILSRKATIPEARERYLVAVGDMHHTKSTAARALGLSPHNFIVQYNRAKKRKL